MPESIKTRLKRWMYNFYPVYRRTGSQITYIDASWKEVRIALPLRFWTKNQVEKKLGKEVFTPNFELEFGMLKKLGIV